MRHLVILAGALCIATVELHAQDTLSLRTLTADALRLDPRQRQLALQQRASDLRLRNIDVERKPTIAADGQAQYQSAITKIAIPLPGVTIPTPPNDTYDAHLSAQLSLVDPTLAPRRAAERAQLAETQAATRATLFSLRQDINEAFFSAAGAQERLAVLDATIVDLQARLREMAIKFREGAALPGDTASIAAALLQREQDVLQLRATRSAALARVSDLVGRTVGDTQLLVVADETTAVGNAIRDLDSLRARPEYKQFAAMRDRLELQTAVDAAQEKPRVSAFGRLGYGRPGLDLLSRDFQSYWLGGVQVHWSPWTWGTTDRNREIAEAQRDVVTTNEAAFTRGLRRGVQESIAAMTRLESTMALDDRIVALREHITTETGARLHEGVVTAADYVDKSTDLMAARLLRAQHHVELAQARTTFLTTLGVEVP
jgi:outer membrane protein TolC